MLRKIQRGLFFVALFGFASVAPLAWAGHGHGGGGHGGGGHGGGGHSGGGHSGGGHSYYGGGDVHLGVGGLYYGSGHYHGWPSYYYYDRPYSVYPYGYYGDNGYYYSSDQPPREYVVSRPVMDVARVEVRLPDPQGKVWIQGKEMSPTGTVRRFNSPTLDPSGRYVYTVKAEWYDKDRLVTDERKVSVQANSSVVVDFNPRNEDLRVGSRDRSSDIPAPQRPVTE